MKTSLFHRFIPIVLLLFCALPPLHAGTPDLATVLRALQERHMAVEQRKAIEQINGLQIDQQDFGLAATFANQVTVTPIDWGHGLGAMPESTEVNGLTLEQQLMLLHLASERFDDLKKAYLNLSHDLLETDETPFPGSGWHGNARPFSEWDLPSPGAVSPGEFHGAMLQLAENTGRLRLLKWPAMGYTYPLSTASAEPWGGGADWQVWEQFTMNNLYGLGGWVQDYGETSPQTVNHLDTRAFIPVNSDQLTPDALFQHLLLVEESDPWLSWASSSILVNPPVLFRDDWGEAFFYSGAAGGNFTEGAFYRFELGDDLHPLGVSGTLREYNSLSQSAGTPEGPYPVQFLPAHPPTTPGYVRYEGTPPLGVMKVDPLVMGHTEDNMAFRFGDQAMIVDWNHSEEYNWETHMVGARPVYHDPAFTELDSYDLIPFWFDLHTFAYAAYFHAFGIFAPDFEELTAPHPLQNKGPGDLGNDDASPLISPRHHYTIELGNGRYTRGHTGRLTALWHEDGFELRFHGDMNEYEIPLHTPEEQIYIGEWIKTTVEHDSENNTITVTQSLAKTLPDGMGAMGTEIKKFEFVIHAEPENDEPHVNLTCTYFSGSPNITREWSMTGTTLYAGHDRTSPPMKWVRGPSSVGGGYLSMQTHQNGVVVSETDVKFLHHPRFAGMPLVVEEIQRSLDVNTNDRVRTFAYHENGLLKEASWNGPGPYLHQFNELGIQTLSQTSTLSHSEYLTGNDFGLNSMKYLGANLDTEELNTLQAQDHIELQTLNGSLTYTDHLRLWVPSPDLPAGQHPWMPKSLQRHDGLWETWSEIHSTDGVVSTHFEGKINTGNLVPIEGTRTVTTLNALGRLKEQKVEWVSPEATVTLSHDKYTHNIHGVATHRDLPSTQAGNQDDFVSVSLYNAAGEILSTKDRESHATFAYDDFGRMESMEDLLTGVITTVSYQGFTTTHTTSHPGINHDLTRAETVNAFGETVRIKEHLPHLVRTDIEITPTTTLVQTRNHHTHEIVREHTDLAAGSHTVTTNHAEHGVRTRLIPYTDSMPPAVRLRELTERLGPGLLADTPQKVEAAHYLNGTGRVLKSEVLGPGGDGMIQTTFVYDTQNRLKRVEGPENWLHYEYDDLGRVHQEGVTPPGTASPVFGFHPVQLTQQTASTNGLLAVRKTYVLDALNPGGAPLPPEMFSELTRPHLQEVIRTQANHEPEVYRLWNDSPGVHRMTRDGRDVFLQTPHLLETREYSAGDTPTRIERVILDAFGRPVREESVVDGVLSTRELAPTGDPTAVTTAGRESAVEVERQPDTPGHSYTLTSAPYQQPGGGTYPQILNALHDPVQRKTGLSGSTPFSYTSRREPLANGGFRIRLNVAVLGESILDLNPAGFPIAKTLGSGEQSAFTWTPSGRPASLTTPSGLMEFSHDPLTGALTGWSHDGYEALESVHNSLGQIVSYSDDSGTVSVGHDYDVMLPDRIEWEAGLLAGYRLQRQYDNRGRPHTLTLTRNGETLLQQTLGYHGEGERVAQTTLAVPGAASRAISYNGAHGLPDTVTHELAQGDFTRVRGRDPEGLPASLSSPGHPALSHAWSRDSQGRLETLTWGDGAAQTARYHPDSRRLLSLSPRVPQLPLREFTFDGGGRLEQEKLDGQVLDHTPAAGGSLTVRQNSRVVMLHGSVNPAATTVLVNSNAVSHVNGAFSAQLLWDLNGQNVTQTTGAALIPWEVTGKIEDETAGFIGGVAIADLEGLFYLPPAVQSITYRPGGEVENDGRHAFEWDPAGRLTRTTSLEPGLPLDVQHTYDGYDRRVRKIVTRGDQVRDHRYIYDGWLPVAEEIRDGLGNLRATRVYVWGPGDDGVRDTMDGPAGRLAAIAHTENGVTRVSYPVYNWRHDVIALIDAHSGAVVARYEYEAFGRRTATGPRAGDCPFGFATAYHDETGHVYFGYRHYDPEMKQWLSRDPLGERGGFNLYAYANGDPVNYVDTLGLWGKRLDDVDFRIHRGVPQVLMRERRQNFFGVWIDTGTADQWVDATPVQIKYWALYKSGDRAGAREFAVGQFDFYGGYRQMLWAYGGTVAIGTGVGVGVHALPAMWKWGVSQGSLALSSSKALGTGIVTGNKALALAGGANLVHQASELAMPITFGALDYFIHGGTGATYHVQPLISPRLKARLAHRLSSWSNRSRQMFMTPGGRLVPVSKMGSVGVGNSNVAGINTMGRRLQRLGYDQTNINRLMKSINRGDQIVVVGENMRRVNAVANMVRKAGGSPVTYNPRNWSRVNRNSLEANRNWLRYWIKDRGAPVIDIGRQLTIRRSGPSPFYGIENRSLHHWGVYTPFGR